MNLASRDVISMVVNIVVAAGNWVGYVNFLVVPLDVFYLILGNDFFLRAKVTIVPHLSGLFIMDELQTCFIQGKLILKDESNDSSKVNNMLSATQVKNGLRRG